MNPDLKTRKKTPQEHRLFTLTLFFIGIIFHSSDYYKNSKLDDVSNIKKKHSRNYNNSVIKGKTFLSKYVVVSVYAIP